MDEPRDDVGAILANARASMGATDFRRLRLEQVRAVGMAWFRVRPFVFVPLVVAQLVLFAAGGLSHTRVLVLGAVYGVLVTHYLAIALRIRLRLSVPAHTAFASHLVALVANAFGIAFTGGLASPLAPMLLGPVTGTLVSYGRSRETTVTIALAASILLTLLALPSSWLVLPHAIPHATASYITGLSLCFALVIQSTTTVSLSDAFQHAGEQLVAMREEMLEDALARARSLESIGARVAHEVKNPLASVKALVQLAVRNAPDARSAERMTVAESEIARMEAILRDYLTFSRPLEQLHPERVDPGVLADQVLAVLEARAANANVTLARVGDAPVIRGDARQLKAALLNLATNALEATPPGGIVTMALQAGKDGGASIAVCDTGRGIPATELPRVGTAFFTTRANGTGLGVVLARATVQQHGGTLEYESDVGRGTTAWIALPPAAPEGDARATAG